MKTGKGHPWAGRAAAVTTVLAVLGSIYGGGGGDAGFLVALVLNPIAWLAVWFFYMARRVYCPDCNQPLRGEIQPDSNDVVRCPACGCQFRRGKQGPAETSTPVKTEPAAETPITIRSAPTPASSESDTGDSSSLHTVAQSDRTPEPDLPAEVAETETSPVDVETVALATELTVQPADPEESMLLDEAADQSFPPEHIVMRVDGSSSFLTLSEHFKRSCKELAGCDISKLNFTGSSFRGANLKGARLDGSDFTGCDFRDADLTDCSARNCKFDHVKFSGAQLVRTAFTGSSLRDTTFFQVHAVVGSTTMDPGHRFSNYDHRIKTIDATAKTEATLVESVGFEKCDLRGAAFVAPRTIDTETTKRNQGGGDTLWHVRQTFGTCQPRACRFAKSILSELDFHGLDFAGSDLNGTNLHGTNLTGADIQGVDLSESNLINARLYKLKYDGKTRLPDGYALPPDAVNMDEKRAADQARREQQQKTNRTIVVALIMAVVVMVGICVAIVIQGANTESVTSSALFDPDPEPSPPVAPVANQLRPPAFKPAVAPDVEVKNTRPQRRTEDPPAGTPRVKSVRPQRRSESSQAVASPPDRVGGSASQPPTPQGVTRRPIRSSGYQMRKPAYVPAAISSVEMSRRDQRWRKIEAKLRTLRGERIMWGTIVLNTVPHVPFYDSSGKTTPGRVEKELPTVLDQLQQDTTHYRDSVYWISTLNRRRERVQGDALLICHLAAAKLTAWRMRYADTSHEVVISEHVARSEVDFWKAARKTLSQLYPAAFPQPPDRSGEGKDSVPPNTLDRKRVLNVLGIDYGLSTADRLTTYEIWDDFPAWREKFTVGESPNSNR